MDLNLENKIAIVTGASEGIGLAIAKGLAKERVKLSICARRPEPLGKACKEIEQETQVAVNTFVGDMTIKADAQQFVDQVVARWGTVHILINNVGRAIKAFFEDLQHRDWYEAFQCNFYSAIYCSEAVIPYMRRQKWGRIINIVAISGKEPTFNFMASNVTKTSLLSFSKTLAREVASDNILVNSICPSRILSTQSLRALTEEERKIIASKEIPLKRFGTCEELANLVVFLASECSSYITGVCVPVDGGISRSLY